MKTNIRTIRDRDTDRHHFVICLPCRTIIHNRRTNGSATKKLALIKAQAICAEYGRMI